MNQFDNSASENYEQSTEKVFPYKKNFNTLHARHLIIFNLRSCFMDEKQQFFRYIAELGSENPNINALNEAKAFVFSLARIPLLFSIFHQGIPNEVFYARIVLTKIMKPNYLATSNQQTFHTFIFSLSDEDHDNFIQDCVGLMKKSDAFCVFFSKVICKLYIFSYRARFAECIQIFNQKLGDFIERLYSTKNRQFIKPASQLFKRVLQFSNSLEEPQDSLYSYLNEIMVQIITGGSINLELAASFVQAYCKAHFTGASFLFGDENHEKYCDIFSKIALFSRDLFQQYAQLPFFLEFLEANFSFLYKYLTRLTSFQNIPNIQDHFIPRLIPAAVDFILFITQVYPQNPIVEKIVYHLLPLVNRFLGKAEPGFQENIEQLQRLIDVAYTFSCPSQDEISDFPENYRNYYVSVFSDHRTPFVSALSIIEQICQTLNVDAISYICQLLQQKPGENSIFVISSIYPYLVDNLTQDSETAVSIIEFLTVYCNQCLPMLNDASIPDRVKYTIFWMIGECITAFQIEPIVEIIGGLLQSLVQIQPDGSKQLAIPDPLIMIKFSFASNIALALFENFPGIQLPEEAITIFLLCHNTTFSTSSLKLLQRLISISPNEEMQVAIVTECIEYLNYFFSPGVEKDSLETAFANDRFSLIEFISTHHLDGFPTENFIKLINIHLESLLDEVYLASVLAIVTNIIKNQPHAEIALEFAITNGDTASFGSFRKELANVYYQSFVSIPAEVLNNYLPRIYQQIISVIQETMIPELTKAVQTNSYNNAQDCFIDYAADLNVLSRLIQLQRESLPPETLQEIWTVLLGFWDCQYNQERKPMVAISIHITLSFYDVMASLCLCTSFDRTLAKQYLGALKTFILLGFFSTFYYRRLLYSVSMILIRHPEFQDIAQDLDEIIRIMVEGSVQKNPKVDEFLHHFSYFYVDADILAPVELLGNFPSQLQLKLGGDQNIDETQ